MILKQISINKLPYLFLLFGSLIFGVYLVISFSRIGEYPLVISSSPNDANISLDNKQLKSGKAYFFKPGVYSVSISKSGYKTKQTSLTIKGGENSFNFVLDFDSSETENYYNKNPEKQSQRESVGAKQASESGLLLEEKHPILKLLPYSSLDTYSFSVDYGFSDDGGVFLVISDAGPEGRKEAISWLQNRGVSISEYDLRFDSFSSLWKESSR
jgi:PEGA domain